jgi:uncharacterized protein (TIGR00251 family)
MKEDRRLLYKNYLIKFMRIYIKVIPRSSQSRVEKLADGTYKVWVTVVPEKGKANKEVIKLLAKYFQVSKSQVEIVGGQTTRIKMIDINQ